MAIALDGSVYMCWDCENGGSLADYKPLKAESMGLVQEKDVVNHEIGHRVLGIVFADRTPGSHLASKPVLVLDEIEINPDNVAPGFGKVIVDQYASCYGPREDGSCPALDTCKLAQLLDGHRINKAADSH